MGRVVLDRKTLKKELGSARRRGLLVFTNGCFDLLHVGHVRYLQEAKKLGGTLVVAVNSDASVRRLKGPSRPLTLQGDRAEILAALACVDYVTVFDEDTPLDLIRLLEPDVLAKGADWKKEDVIGREIVEARGGRVALVPLAEGRSTTGLINKVLGR